MLQLVSETKVPLHLDDETWFCACPACKGQARKRRWEQIEGSINFYSTINCDCGYAWSSEKGVLFDPRFDLDIEDVA